MPVKVYIGKSQAGAPLDIQAIEVTTVTMKDDATGKLMVEDVVAEAKVGVEAANQAVVDANTITIAPPTISIPKN